MKPVGIMTSLILCLAACGGHLGLVIVENDTSIRNDIVFRAAELVLDEPLEELSPGLDIHMSVDQQKAQAACNGVRVSGCFTRWLGAWPQRPDRIVVWAPPGVAVWETSLVHELVHRYQFDRLVEYGAPHPPELFGPGGMVERIDRLLAWESGE